ncbi:hypothetical protein FKW77_005972 [Venturia effusa]|uniref:Uncharacterized protein n=1 Tax=Venturia effusa TaxID=50376 RepID=A0A517LIU4_9PEZI|nr:hypothetical protein FKW77_005972 [Venturia effusa]
MTKAVVRKAGKGPASSASKRTPSNIPAPFAPAPESFHPFLSTLDKSSVYITHIDRHPAFFKKQIFSVPVALNVTITLLLLWRAYVVVPQYFFLLLFLLGDKTTGTSLDGKSTTRKEMVWFVLERGVKFFLDYVLVTVVAKWPYTFFMEFPHNPISWRWTTGFRDEEIVVRVSRAWDGGDLVSGVKRGGESPFFKTKVLPALDHEFMLKTGYVMMNDSWDLDFGAMVNATKLVDKKELKLEDFDRRVFVWVPTRSGSEEGEWAVWNEKTQEEQVLSVTSTSEFEEPEEASEGRQKILQIQSKLQEMGKEDLFFRWVEMIQYESTRPGGFTKERQLEAGLKVQKLFEEHGVDFEKFEESIGGIS